MDSNMEYDDDLDFVEAYDCTNPKNEPRPDSIVYHAKFAELKKKCQEAANLLLEPLQESKYHNVITKGLLQEVRTRTKNESSEESMFAVAGDMASGRVSSLTFNVDWTLILF